MSTLVILKSIYLTDLGWMLIGLRMVMFQVKNRTHQFNDLAEYADSLFTFQFSLIFHFYHFITFHFSLCHFTRDSPKQIKLGSDVMIKDFKSDLTTGPLF